MVSGGNIHFPQAHGSGNEKREGNMKIPLHIGQENGSESPHAQQVKALDRDLKGARNGDWNSKTNLIRTFMPLLHNLAEKRASTPADLNLCIEAGKNGLLEAINKYKPSVGPERFQIFALEYIESAMDRRKKSGRGFFARLFGLNKSGDA